MNGMAYDHKKATMTVTSKISNTEVYQQISDACKQATQDIMDKALATMDKALAIMDDIQAAAPPIWGDIDATAVDDVSGIGLVDSPSTVGTLDRSTYPPLEEQEQKHFLLYPSI